MRGFWRETFWIAVAVVLWMAGMMGVLVWVGYGSSACKAG